MKRKFLSLLILPLFFLTGCTNKQTGISSGKEIASIGTTGGDLFYTANVDVKAGQILDCSISVTYSPSTWAQLDTSSVTKLGDDVVSVDVNEDGNIDYYYAKYIQIGEMQFTGSVRDSESDAAFSRGEYVCYRYNNVEKEDDALTDLIRYLDVSDSGTTNYKSNVEWYVSSVLNNNIKILKGTQNGDTMTYSDSGVSPIFPNNKAKKNDVESSWTSSINALLNYVKNLGQFNFVSNGYVNDDDLNQHNAIKVENNAYYINNGYSNGTYDDQAFEKIEGVSTTDINETNLRAYLTTLNNAYSRVEYESY